jgi:hypothetical protein
VNHGPTAERGTTGSRGRRGGLSKGCLFTLVVAAAVVFFGANVGRVYWRFFEFQRAMRQETRGAARRTDNAIVTSLRGTADSLKLPESARDVRIRRTQTMISIQAEYAERLDLPFYARTVRLNPHAEGPL